MVTAPTAPAEETLSKRRPHRPPPSSPPPPLPPGGPPVTSRVTDNMPRTA